MRPLLGVRFERHLNGEKLNASLAELLRGEELSHLLSWHARSWLQIRALSCVSSRYSMQRWVFSAQTGGQFWKAGSSGVNIGKLFTVNFR